MNKFKRHTFLPKKIAERDITYDLGSAFKSNGDFQSCIRLVQSNIWLNLHLMHLVGQFNSAHVKSDA